jgi:hypothetical protein
MNKIKIISDGTALGTMVHAGGTVISGIQKIEIFPIVPSGMVTARITFILPELDVIAALSDDGTVST